MGKRKSRTQKKIKKVILEILIVIVIALICSCIEYYEGKISEKLSKISAFSQELEKTKTNINIEEVPQYSGNPYIEINGNKPYFKESEYTTKTFEEYSKLDSLGRCGVAYANICEELMPTGKRESINSVKPSGWKNKSYPGLVDGNYLYNRCHLIGYQLAGENANEKNLITGTRYFNVEGMLPFEDLVDDYIEENENNHVLYRVTPIYTGNNLVANGVEMEGYSVEDNGKGVCFNVYVYNIQPGIEINYATGDSYKK